MKQVSNMNKTERIILKDLYESTNGLYTYTFFSRYKIEPEAIFFFIKKYSEKKILEYNNDRLNLTSEGRDIILKQLFNNKPEKGKFNNIPSDFLKERININSPYLPNLFKFNKK
ncbi:hypothetical protein [Flavobacterium sp. C4GT6]|uniref:hypothetical protein n=1 Tax=Flavobacterium sp. C4GT6 TaxID=3103818 RepID=UPI002ED0020F